MAYKPVPVWHSSRGYTGFVNTGAVVTADVGHSRPSVLSIGVDDPVIDLYVVAGADPAARLTAYTALTGRPDVPQPWAFGYWMGRCRYHTSEEMLEVGRTMREHEVPLDVLHLDPDWLVVDRLNTDFIWNTSRFGDRKQFVADLADLGIRLSRVGAPVPRPGLADLRARRARGVPRQAGRRQPRGDRQDADPRRADAGAHRLHQPGREAVVAGDAPRVPRRRRRRVQDRLRRGAAGRRRALRRHALRTRPTTCTRCATTVPSRTRSASSPTGRRWSGVAADGPARSAIPASGAATPSRRSPGCRRRSAAGCPTP